MAADGAGGAAEDADADAGGAARGRTRAAQRRVAAVLRLLNDE